jgi:hypothetical protein
VIDPKGEDVDHMTTIKHFLWAAACGLFLGVRQIKDRNAQEEDGTARKCELGFNRQEGKGKREPHWR